MHDCKISVIIPVYNAEQLLRQCLDSVLQQSLPQIEILLINDASSDDSQLIIDEYLMADDRFKVIRLKQNSGVSTARNAGIKKAIGEYVIFLDADDYWGSPRMLQQLYDKVIAEQADLISFGFCRVDEAGHRNGFKVEMPSVVNLQQQDNWQIKYNVWAKLVSRKLLIDNDIRFEPSLVMGEDALFSIAVYCNASRLVTVDEVYYCYRVNQQGANLSQWNSAKLFGTVHWFLLALPLIRASALFKHRPEVLQSVITERLRMLFIKLGPMAFELLSEQEQQRFFTLWMKCLEQYDLAYFNTRFLSDPAIELYRQMLERLQKNELIGLKHFFNSEPYRQSVAGISQVVTLKQQQAFQLGQDLLQVNKPHIRCDFGGGIIVTLPMEKAHQLARQMIANQNAEITLRFNS
ncbi:MAG: glycosyltransferase family 2 protein [Proteobacteria bacterium]|nr:glycosyltransferase family 2 protein [Pseudomonadota bacterium]